MTDKAIPDPTDVPGYGPTAKALHWTIALLVAAQFLVAWTMQVPEEGQARTASFNLHASIGATILILMVIRLIWRAAHPVPLLADLPAWMRVLSGTTHAALYAGLIVAPIAGMITALGEGVPVLLYGVIPLPMLAIGEGIVETAEETHELLALVLLILVGLHIAAALFHYFIRHDRVLQRMLPGR